MFKFVRPKSKQSPKQPQRSDNNVESNSGAQSGQLSTDEHSSSSQALPSWSTTNTTSDAVNVKSNNKISSNPGGNIAIIRPGGGGGGGSSGNYIKNDPNKRSSSTRFEPSSKINSVRSRTFDGLQLIPHKKVTFSFLSDLINFETRRRRRKREILSISTRTSPNIFYSILFLFIFKSITSKENSFKRHLNFFFRVVGRLYI